jgi:hypothetical protein
MRSISASVLPLICRGDRDVRESISATIVVSGAIILFLCAGVFSQETVQVQSSTDGALEATLTQAKVRDQVFSVKLTLKNVTNRDLEPEISFKDFYVTNIKDMKKYFPLQDSQGNFLAAPRNGPGKAASSRIKSSPARCGPSGWIFRCLPTPRRRWICLCRGCFPLKG